MRRSLDEPQKLNTIWNSWILTALVTIYQCSNNISVLFRFNAN
jgi:hypothetical protein